MIRPRISFRENNGRVFTEELRFCLGEHFFLFFHRTRPKFENLSQNLIINETIFRRVRKKSGENKRT